MTGRALVSYVQEAALKKASVRCVQLLEMQMFQLDREQQAALFASETEWKTSWDAATRTARQRAACLTKCSCRCLLVSVA